MTSPLRQEITSLSDKLLGWRDISTAPKDGHCLLYGRQTDKSSDVRFKGEFVTTGYWDAMDEAWCATGSNWTGPFLEPSHWMPLPEPPEGSGRSLADATKNNPPPSKET